MEALERRDFEGELRVETRGLQRVLKGYAIVFGRLSENLGGFREMIMAEAMDRTLREGVDLRALIGHDPDKVLGRLSAGTLRVEKDPHGLRVEIDPPAQHAGLMESVQRRDVTGMSFAFHTMADAWDFKADPPVRSITDMLVREVSVVTFPAYPATEVALRSLAQHRQASRTPLDVLRARLAAQRLSWRK